MATSYRAHVGYRQALTTYRGTTARYGSVALAGQGSLSPHAITGAVSHLTVTGTGTLGASGFAERYCSLALAGAGSLTPHAIAGALGHLSVTGTGALSPHGIAGAIARTRFAGVGQLVPHGVRGAFASVRFEGYGFVHDEIVTGLRSGTQPHTHVEVT